MRQLVSVFFFSGIWGGSPFSPPNHFAHHRRKQIGNTFYRSAAAGEKSWGCCLWRHWHELFFRIFLKNFDFFFNEVDCKKFSNCFSMNSAVKNFEDVLLLNSLKKISKTFLIVNFIENKNSTFFRKIRNKHFCHKKKGGYRVGILTFFSREIWHDLSLGLMFKLMEHLHLQMTRLPWRKKKKRHNIQCIEKAVKYHLLIFLMR